MQPGVTRDVLGGVGCDNPQVAQQGRVPSRHSRENAASLPSCAAASTVANASPITAPSIGSQEPLAQQMGILGPDSLPVGYRPPMSSLQMSG